VLLQACRRWRVIAITTPTLWTDIVIPSSGDHRLDLDAALLYVERSGSCPVSLIWHHRGWNQPTVVHDILSPILGRLKNITISTRGFRSRDSLLAILKAMSFPILESLRCYVSRFPFLDNAALATVNLHTPRLRHGAFTNYLLPTGAFSSLVTLEIALSPGLIWRFNAAKLFDLLCNVAQTLKFLRFRASNAVLQGYAPSTHKIQLPELVALDLRSTSKLLTFISTPNLRTLILEDYTGDPTSPFTSFRAPKLTHLELDGIPLLDLETIPDFPWRFQELGAVELYDCRSTKSFFRHASSIRNSVPAFPSLHSIVINDPDTFPSIRSMVERLSAAYPGYPGLKRLRIVTWVRALEVADMEWLTAQGIRFSEGLRTKRSWTSTGF